MYNSIPYPSDPSQEVRLPVAQLQPVVEQLLVKHSMFLFDAKVAAARLLEADLYGVPSHGTALLCRILNAIDCGDIDPRGRVLTLTDAPCFATLDASRAIGSVAATKGAELAIAKAKEHGVGVVAMGNGQTLGAAEVYVRLMAAAGVLGICCTSTGGATVSAPGSRAGAVGNCAFAYAVPLQGRVPLVFDSACGTESWGKLALLQRYGLPLPEGILFDSQQAPVTQFESAVAMLPAGGPLGFGLSMLCSILAGPLCNGWMPIHKKRRTDAEDSQHFFLALDPARFCDVDKFNRELQKTLDEIVALPAVNPADPVRIPGVRGAACYEDNLQQGIPLHRSIAEEIKARALKKKVAVEW
ncbi:Ldh family oxidoreductase [Planctomicrobium piriforme]|nr:Ldh family oxidoreductase [Planctomicrobium piriforme]